VGQALSNDPIPIYQRNAEGECRSVCYGESHTDRLLAAVVTERGERMRAATAMISTTHRGATISTGAVSLAV
jgi:hypothetical protein